MAWRGESVVGVFPLTRLTATCRTLLVSVPYAVYGGRWRTMTRRTTPARNGHGTGGPDAAQWLDVRSIHARWPGLPVLDQYVTFRKILRMIRPRLAKCPGRPGRRTAGTRAVRADLPVRRSALEQVWRLYSQSMPGWRRRITDPLLPGAACSHTNEDRRQQPGGLPAAAGHVVQIVEHQGGNRGLVSSSIATRCCVLRGCDRDSRSTIQQLHVPGGNGKGSRTGCREFDSAERGR